MTQNVDRLHTRAGSKEVLELRGSLTNARCFHRGHPYPVHDFIALAKAAVEEAVEPPECVICGSPVRPGVVWFGESLSPEVLDAASDAVSQADVVLLVGTSSVVYPAAQLPIEARRHGASIIEINPDRTPFTNDADVYWNETAGRALPALARCLALNH